MKTLKMGSVMIRMEQVQVLIIIIQTEIITLKTIIILAKTLVVSIPLHGKRYSTPAITFMNQLAAAVFPTLHNGQVMA